MHLNKQKKKEIKKIRRRNWISKDDLIASHTFDYYSWVKMIQNCFYSIKKNSKEGSEENRLANAGLQLNYAYFHLHKKENHIIKIHKVLSIMCKRGIDLMILYNTVNRTCEFGSSSGIELNNPIEMIKFWNKDGEEWLWIIRRKRQK